MPTVAHDPKYTVAWKPHEGPQTLLLSCPFDEIFYGGARGGGKTAGILAHWLKHSAKWGSHAKGIIFRRTFDELEEIIQQSDDLFPKLGAYYAISKRTWEFPNRSKLLLRFLDKDDQAKKYLGRSYTWIGMEEITNWKSPDPVDKIKGCLRSAHGVRCQWVATGNPGGLGHNWVKARFIDPSPPFVPYRDAVTGSWRVFIPAKLEDNFTLMANDPTYGDRLKGTGPEWLVKAWREGIWDIVAGGMFDDIWDRSTHVLRPFAIPKHWIVERAFDWGSSAPFSIGWWATCTGEPIVLPDKSELYFARGTKIRIAEWYGWNGKPNKGLNMVDTEIAREAVMLEKRMMEAHGYRIQEGPADPAIFAITNGHSIAQAMGAIGLDFIPASTGPGSRVTGWETMRRMLTASKKQPMEEPGLFVFDTCRQFIRTVPTLPRDLKKIEDVDCLVAGTLVETARGQIPIEQVRVGELVHTPLGLRHVVRSNYSGIAPTVAVQFSNGQTLTGTLNHGVFTYEHGLVPLSELQPGMTVEERESAWSKLSSTMRSSIAAILGDVTTTLTAVFSPTVAQACIDKSGSIILAQSRQAMSCITKTTIPSTIDLRTWSRFLTQFMHDSISKRGSVQGAISQSSWMLGDAATQGNQPFARMLIQCTHAHQSENLRVLIVAALLERKTLNESIARLPAPKPTAWDSVRSHAVSVVSYLVSRLMRRKKSRLVVTSVAGPCGDAAVYNLTVEQAHLFYANGALVSNTNAEDHVGDETRYALTHKRREVYTQKLVGV